MRFIVAAVLINACISTALPLRLPDFSGPKIPDGPGSINSPDTINLPDPGTDVGEPGRWPPQNQDTNGPVLEDGRMPQQQPNRCKKRADDSCSDESMDSEEEARFGGEEMHFDDGANPDQDMASNSDSDESMGYDLEAGDSRSDGGSDGASDASSNTPSISESTSGQVKTNGQRAIGDLDASRGKTTQPANAPNDQVMQERYKPQLKKATYDEMPQILGDRSKENW